MRFLLFLIIIALSVATFVEHRAASTARDESANGVALAENSTKIAEESRGKLETLQRQLDDANRQLADGKNTTQILADTKKQVETQSAEAAKQATEIEAWKTKLAESQARVNSLTTDLATAKTQVSEAARAQEPQRRTPAPTLLDRPPR